MIDCIRSSDWCDDAGPSGGYDDDDDDDDEMLYWVVGEMEGE